jgi:hypothetical protein
VSLTEKIAKRLTSVSIGKLSDVPLRDWARRPRSQKAVDLAIAGKLFSELADAREAGYVVGDKWVAPEKRGKK